MLKFNSQTFNYFILHSLTLLQNLLLSSLASETRLYFQAALFKLHIPNHQVRSAVVLFTPVTNLLAKILTAFLTFEQRSFRTFLPVLGEFAEN